MIPDFARDPIGHRAQDDLQGVRRRLDHAVRAEALELLPLDPRRVGEREAQSGHARVHGQEVRRAAERLDQRTDA
ncbi:MAG TPA: hypothetical protein VE175_05710, partial [Woeseiaceae bacterium]|nr:hypothetical protein [Woeseiaceae bacterium]